MNRPGRSNALILFVFLVLSTIVYAYDFLTDAGDSVGYGKYLGENITAQNQSLMILTGTTGYVPGTASNDGGYGQSVSESTGAENDGASGASITAGVSGDGTMLSDVPVNLMDIKGIKNMNLAGNLTDYNILTTEYYNIDSKTYISKNELNGEYLAGKDMSIDMSENGYQVLIYHTHASEAFADSDGSIEDTIVGTGEYLAELLNKRYGINVYHDTTVYDMAGGTLDRSLAYDYAREGVKKILEEHPEISVVIDLHRDGVADDVHLVTEVNGKPTARIMFLNGISRTREQGNLDYLKNTYIEDNLAFSLQLFLTAKANYGDYMRKLMVKSYRYNLDLRGRSLLVEAGAQTNTCEEAKNAMEPLAAVLYKVLSGE